LPIGLTAVAVDGSDAYLAQIATGQAFLARGADLIAWPSFRHWQALHSRVVEPEPALGQTPDLTPVIMHSRLEPGDLLVLVATNLARVIDAETLGAMVRQYGDNVVAGLCRLAEDYGLPHTSGMALTIDGPRQATFGASPLSIQQFWPQSHETTPLGVPEQVDADWPLPIPSATEASDLVAARAVAPVAPLVASDDQLAEHRGGTSDLPANMVRLYATLPTPPPDAAGVTDQDDLAEPDEPERSAPSIAARSLRARWLDALAASMVVATDFVRAPRPTGPRAASARRSAASRPVAGLAEPLYRGDGSLSPAGAEGFASPAVALSNLRWPSVSANQVLMAVMVVVAGLLLVLGVQMFASQRSATSTPVQPAATPAPAPLAETGPRLGAPAPASDTPASPVSTISASAAAVSDGAVPSVTRVLVRADAFERTPVASSVGSGLAAPARLGPVTVLADLSATGTPSSTPKQLVVGKGNVYVLDPYSSTLYLVDSSGKPQSTLLARGWSIAREKVQDLLGVTWRGDTLVVMDRNRAYTLDGPSGTWRVSPLAGAALGAGVHQVASYDGGLYVLDSVRGQVLKFAQGAYQKAPLPWLKATDKSDLAGAIDLAIDGKIYALTATGALVTLMRGEVERRQTINVTPALTSPAALVSPPNSAYLYVADTGGRVIKLSKDGAVVAQYLAPEGASLTNLSSLWVDETNQQVYAVAGNSVVRLAMPASSRSTTP
jgi:hypothetical protein